jgi:uncharacterized protein (DUF1810 family)
MSLDRFVAAQAPCIDAAMAELREGRKRTHWMWFVFPQLRGLGRSDMARRYGIEHLAEARAYLAHPVLGPRLDECTRLVALHPGRDVHAIFGSPDDVKFHSSMTLFARAGAATCEAALGERFAGVEDPGTVRLLG